MRQGKFNKGRKIGGSANKKSYLPYIEMDGIRSALRRDCIASYNTIFFYSFQVFMHQNIISFKMQHQEFEPPEALPDTIKCFWYDNSNFGASLSKSEVLAERKDYSTIISLVTLLTGRDSTTKKQTIWKTRKIKQTTQLHPLIQHQR